MLKKRPFISHGGIILVILLFASLVSAQALPPVPVPPENPITESKRVLGKILYWEEQVSSDNTVACGTCHIHEIGSADPNIGVHPGADGFWGNEDDIFGSFGIRRQDATGSLINDPTFGYDVQVTGRTSPGFAGNLWSPDLFWDGRATSEFVDPETGAVVISSGGALESQAVGPILSDVEMAHENRNWADVRAKLETAIPMALATELPADMADALVGNPAYGDLFTAAFGTPDITAARIGMAIATYERTLVPDQTPWDLDTMTAAQEQGLMVFQMHDCADCHTPPFFTDHSYRNIGLRDPGTDGGRFDITGDVEDRGKFKVPSLRNVKLRNRLMHTGHITDVADAIAFYRGIGHRHFTDNQDPLVLGGIQLMDHATGFLVDFLENGLTDPRAEAGEFPFDRPRLASEALSAAPVIVNNTLKLSTAPNPFTSTTTISYTFAGAGPVELAVYDLRGSLVRRVVSTGSVDGGSFSWDGRSTTGEMVSTGVYLVRVTTSLGTATTRIVMTR